MDRDSDETSFEQAGPSLLYLDRDSLYISEKPYITTFDTAELGGPSTNCKFTAHTINAQNADATRTEFNLDVNGLQFLQRPTALRPADFEDEDLVHSIYFPEIIELVRNIRPELKDVKILSYTRRDSSIEKGQGKINSVYGPASHAHAGFTLNGAVSLLQRYFGSRDILCEPFEILNVWRVTHAQTRSWPLAMCDYQSLSIPKDIETRDVVHRTYVGEGTLLYWNPGHRWHFLDNQRVEDVIVFRQTSSRGTSIPFAAHASFENDSKGVEPRNSIEVRVVCFY